MDYDPNVWGPHYWFFIHSVGFTYPDFPDDGVKKQYYNFITSLPLFIPNKAVAKHFQSLLDDYPISSYLNSKDSFLKWIHFIHNKINTSVGKKEMSYLQFIDNYNNLYKPKTIIFREQRKNKERVLYTSVIASLLVYICYNYKNI